MGGMSDAELLKRFQDWDTKLEAHYGAWRKEAKQCFEFVAGRQWDPEDVAKMKEANRSPVGFNRVGPIIDAVSGAEITDRQEVRFYPREVGDSGVNELLTAAAEWVRDECDAEVEESDAFRDAFICGLGWTETRMDYEEEPDGKILIERVDPLEVLPDCSARKPNVADARYIRRKRHMSEDAFKELFPGEQPYSSDERPGQSVNNPAHRYEGDDTVAEGECVVCEYQWYEVETSHLVALPNATDLQEFDAETFADLQKAAEEEGVKVQSVERRRRTYWRAFVAGNRILKYEPLPDGEFTLKAITGKRDRNEGIWYGLVRAMIDPQRFANKFFSQILHLINVNAKGGLLAEADAFADPKQAEESWAKADAITWATPGSLASGAVQPKIAPPIPPLIPAMMEASIAAIRDTTGVNQELLGMVERDQPGILEHQRKQSAYGILAAFFDSLRRYRKMQGRLLLKYIQRYLPAGTLIRIVGDNGVAKYVPLVKQADTAKFDVIVDEAPAGPNQKAQTFAVMSQMLPLVKDKLSPQMLAEVIRYSPLPEGVANKFAEALMTPPDPEQQALAKTAAQAEVGKKVGEARKANADASKSEAEAQQTNFETQAMSAFSAIPAVG